MSAYSDAVLADSPVAYWRLDETSGTNANDAGSNNLDGTYTGGYTLNQASLLLTDADGSVALDGASGSYVTVPDNNLLDLGDGPFTLECWVRQNATGGGLISKTGANGYRLSIGSGASLGKIVLSRATTIVAITGVLVDDTRGHHIVATRGTAGATTNLYLDGVDVTPSINAGAFVNTAAQLLLGAQTTTTERLNGRLDEVAIYASVLTGAQVLNHYMLGRAIGVGQATETDTAQGITFARGAQVGQAAESDTAFPVTSKKTLTTGQATEADTAQAITPRRSYVLGQATETDTAQAIAAQKVVQLGQASEAETALAITALKTVHVGQAGEMDTALPITVPSAAVTTSYGSGWAMPVKLPRKQQLVLIRGAQETDSAMPITVTKKPPPLTIQEDEFLLLL